MNAAPIPIDQVDARRLRVHTRREVIEVRLTGDVQLDAVLRRLAARGGFVIEERIGDEENAR